MAQPRHRCCSVTGTWPDPRLNDGSRRTRACHLRFCARLRGKFLRPTHRFAWKAHIGVDNGTKLAHTVLASAANVAYNNGLPWLLHGSSQARAQESTLNRSTLRSFMRGRRTHRIARIAVAARRTPLTRLRRRGNTAKMGV